MKTSSHCFTSSEVLSFSFSFLRGKQYIFFLGFHILLEEKFQCPTPFIGDIKTKTKIKKTQTKKVQLQK